jgi:hypothetical protein
MHFVEGCKVKETQGARKDKLMPKGLEKKIVPKVEREAVSRVKEKAEK